MSQQSTTLFRRKELTFCASWPSQMVSLIGTGLTRFGLGVWVLQETGSATTFTLILFFAFIPGAVVLPVAGVLADRWDRRKMMIISDSVAAVVTVVFLLLVRAEALALWHIYVGVFIQLTASAFQWPAYSAVVPLLVSKKQLGRASGLVQTAQAASEVVAPTLAAVRTLIGMSTLPIAYLLAGPMADFVFEPLLMPEGALAGSVGRLIGTGPGRGIGLQLMIVSAVPLLAAVAGALYPRLRLVEEELPDAIEA